MTLDLGLRRRAVSDLAADWEDKFLDSKPSVGAKHAASAKPAKKAAEVATAASGRTRLRPGPGAHGARRRNPGCMLAAAVLTAAAFAGGLTAGVVGTVTVMATQDYPWLDAQLGRVVARLGYEISVEVGAQANPSQPQPKPLTSCTADQPLVERRPGVLDAETFARVQACLTDHPMASENKLNPEGFNGTRGFVIGFSSLGVEQFLRESKFNCGDFNPLVPFFKAARQPETNGFVMNVLVCDQPTDKNTLSVGEHIDDTLTHMKVRSICNAKSISPQVRFYFPIISC